MRQTVLLVTLLLATTAPPPARPEGPLDAELTRQTEAWNKAWLEKDTAVIERLMAPGYDDHRCTLVYARRGRAWLVAWEQCSANAPSPAAEESAAEAAIRKLEPGESKRW